MRTLIKIIFITLTFINCKSVDDSCNNTYFGGQIVNPKSDYITLTKGDKILDTIYLFNDNTFITQLEIKEEGLYYFKHGSLNKGYEYQYIYIEPRDSISIRLNTWDFDESLVFSGKGAEKNNFLIALFLQNEKNNKSFSNYYNLNSNPFEAKIDSIRLINNQFYEQLVNSGVQLTKDFKILAKVAIDYPINLRKEIYPYIYRNRFQLEKYPEVSENYYDFRNETDLNIENLIYFAPYRNYVMGHLYNLAGRIKENNTKTDFSENALNAIVNNISIPNFKNNLLRQAIYDDFKETKSSCAINKKVLTIFNDNCTNTKYLNQINKLARDCENIKHQNYISNFEIATLHNKSISINSIIKNKKSVIYFWSPKMMSSEILVAKIRSLEKQYPTLLFVGISMNSSKDYKINHQLKNQYLLTKESIANSFVSSFEPRTILVDEKGIVSNSFTFLSSKYLNDQLTSLARK